MTRRQTHLPALQDFDCSLVHSEVSEASCFFFWQNQRLCAKAAAGCLNAIISVFPFELFISLFQRAGLYPHATMAVGRAPAALLLVEQP